MRGTTSWIRGTALCFVRLYLLGLCVPGNLEAIEKKISGRIEVGQVRPAVAACDMYKNWWSSHPIAISAHEKRNDKPGEFAQIVGLGYSAGPGNGSVIDETTYNCAGTLISEQYILTAAHCVSNVRSLAFVEVAIVLRMPDYDKPTPRVNRVSVSKIVVHPEYQQGFHYHDIALIELKKPLHIGGKIRPACLMTEPLPTPTKDSNISLTVLSWKLKYRKDSQSIESVKIQRSKSVGKDECSTGYASTSSGGQNRNELDAGMVCVANPYSGRESENCSGSNGEPLFSNWELFPRVVGVAFFGQVCDGSTPRLYTSVYEHLDWIEAQVWRKGVPKTVGCWVLDQKPGLVDYMKKSCITNPCHEASCLCLCDNVNAK